MADHLSETVDDLVASIDELEDVLAPLLATSLPDLSTQLPAPLDRAKLQVWLSYVLNDLVWIHLRTRGINPNNLGAGETHDVVAELDRVKSYFSKIKEAEDPEKRKLAVDGKVANRFIKHALSSAISPANFAPKSTHTRFDENGEPEQPVPATTFAEASKPEPEPEVPTSSSDEEPEAGTWKAKKRAREADLAQSRADENGSDEDEPMSGWEEPGSENAASLPAETVTSTVVTGRPKRNKIDPFAGYDEPRAKTRSGNVPASVQLSSPDLEDANSPSPSASSSASNPSLHKKKRRGTRGGTNKRTREPADGGKKGGLAREALERAATKKQYPIYDFPAKLRALGRFSQDSQWESQIWKILRVRISSQLSGRLNKEISSPPPPYKLSATFTPPLPSASSMSSSSRVLSIPELAELISALGRRSDLARLSRTCRAAFNNLVPRVWKKVNGAHNLLSLIKGTTVKYDPDGKLLEIVLDEHSSSIDLFERFDFYARYVESFAIYKKDEGCCAVSGWSLLKSRAKDRSLLPRLKKFYINIADRPAISQADELWWVTAFVNDRMEFAAIFPPTRCALSVTHAATASILGAVAEGCPNLLTMTLCSEDQIHSPNRPNDEQPRNISIPATQKPWYDGLGGFLELRELLISEGCLSSQCLQAIGKLPRLGHLGILPGGFQPYSLSEDQDLHSLPSNSFPELRYLSMNELDPLTMLDLFKASAMFARIIRLDMSFHLEYLDEGDDREMFLVQDLIPLLVKAPHLQLLRIKVHTLPGIKHSILDNDVARIMQNLPLRNVHFEGIHLRKGRIGYPLRLMWSNVTELIMPLQYASLRELAYFAEMPKLLRLVVSLDLTTTFRLQPRSICDSTSSSLDAIESSQSVKLSSDFNVMKHIARALVALWPNMRSIDWADYESQRQFDLAGLFDCLLVAQLIHEAPGGEGALVANNFFPEIQKALDELRTRPHDFDDALDDDMDSWTDDDTDGGADDEGGMGTDGEIDDLPTSFNTVIDGVVPAASFSINRTDLVRLSQVHRRTFEVLIPAIWECVYGAQNLLKLIESASFVFDDAGKILLDVVLPDSTDGIYERFDFYASYVKYLNVYGANTEAFGVQQWSTLIARSQNRPLLPHLRSIIFSRNPSPGHDYDEASWISCFATITTTEVITAFDKWEPGMFTYVAASRLLEAVVKNCPKVEVLALHPYDEDNEPNSDSPNVPIEAPGNLWYQSLLSLQSLRGLSISNGWLCPPSLQALGQIYTINSLEMHPGNCKGFDILRDLDTTNLPSYAFPILNLLSLRKNSPLTTAKILGIQAMVSHVIHLFIQLGSGLDEGEGESSEFANNLIIMLRNTPNLLQLTIDCEAVGTPEMVYPIESPAALETMAGLPLRAVALGNIYLGSAAFALNLGFIWPNVTVLVMPHQYASLHELSEFARMPQLRRLTILLDLTTISYSPDNHEMSRLPQGPLYALEGSLGSSISLNFRVIEHNAKFIARFWPDARFIQPQTENEDKIWGAMVSLVDQLIHVHSLVRRTEQEEQEEARGILEGYREAWEGTMRNAGFSGGPLDPWPDYVYGGADTTLDYI